MLRICMRPTFQLISGDHRMTSELTAHSHCVTLTRVNFQVHVICMCVCIAHGISVELKNKLHIHLLYSLYCVCNVPR